MLIKQQVLKGIVAGDLDRAFRRWDRPRVKTGSRLRTSVGVLEVTKVEEVRDVLTTSDARRSGFASVDELRDACSSRPGTLYRIGLRYYGEDPRIALRNKAQLTPMEFGEIGRRLDAIDARSRLGAWTRARLRLIRDSEAVRAPDLASDLGSETKTFKASIRRLKELGLTESLDVGYRLSPRGRAFLKLDASAAAAETSLRRRK